MLTWKEKVEGEVSVEVSFSESELGKGELLRLSDVLVNCAVDTWQISLHSSPALPSCASGCKDDAVGSSATTRARSSEAVVYTNHENVPKVPQRYENAPRSQLSTSAPQSLSPTAS